MDDEEYDIYDDLDVFTGDEKQEKECKSCIELREQLNNSQQQNERLTNELNELKKNHEHLKTNTSALLTTSRLEIQRKDTHVKTIQKEKDDICFRRRKVPNVESAHATTQSKISCKPFFIYELKRVDDDQCEKPIEPVHYRRDDNTTNHKNHTTNPFSTKSKENHETKSNPSKNAEKNSNHRHSSRHQSEQINLRSKHATKYRPKENERRDQVDVERTKRKRSPTPSKDNKRTRRTEPDRSHTRSKHERKRNDHEKKSPLKASRNEKTNEKKSDSKEHHKHRSPEKHDLRNRIRQKHEKGDRHVATQIAESHVEPTKTPPKDKETIATKQTPTESTESNNVEITTLQSEDTLPKPKASLEEGEIDDDSNGACSDGGRNFKSKENETCGNRALPGVEENVNEFNGQKAAVVSIDNETELNLPKLDTIYVMPTDVQVQIASTVPIDFNENAHLQHHDEQHENEPQQCQLSNGITHSTVETNENEEQKQCMTAMPIEAKCLNNDSNQYENDVSKVEPRIAFNNFEEVIEMANIQNHLENNVESIAMVDEPIEVIIEPPPELETEPQPIESIPQITQSKNNSTESHDKNNSSSTEPTDDRERSISLLNVSGSKSVNISTSSKDYLIIENENNEQIIFVTRKKKKKKKKSEK